MRYLLMVILAVAAAWAGYWVFGSTSVKNGIETWFDERRAEGWQADYSDLAVRGFPNRFDTSFTDLALADPQTGVAWQLPMFQFMTLSYKPNHIIAVWPETQVVASPFDTFDITSDDMRASLIVDTSKDLRLQSTTLTAAQMQIAPRKLQEESSVEEFSMAAELVEGTTALPRYHLGLRASGLAFSDGLLRLLDPKGKLPQKIEGFTADVMVDFDSYWDQSALEVRRPQPRVIDIRLAEGRWGNLLLQAAGQIEVAEDGTPEGEITIKAENWQDMLAIAQATGKLPENIAALLEDALGILAKMSGNTKNLDVPLSFKSGQIRLGILPIGPAPKIYIR